MITFQHVSKIYGQGNKEVRALVDAHFTVEKGEIFGIIGSSGAGKSTLLRCVNLLEHPTEGSVEVNGKSMTTLSKKELQKARQKIGMIFQHFHLMPSRTIEDNIAFPLKKMGFSKSEIKEKVNKLLELVEIPEKGSFYPSQLSGGQKQRVAIARALVNEPSILLCDEATSALDPQTTHGILQLLKDINKKLGITILLITHEMEVIKEICHKVAVMEQGKVLEMGEVFSVLTSPESELTKNLIKSTTNLEKIQQFMENSVANVEKNEVLVKLTYTQRNTTTPLLSTMTGKFGLEVNIIFADVSLVQGAPLGGTVVILKGEAIESGFEFLKNENVKVEVLKDGRITT